MCSNYIKFADLLATLNDEERVVIVVGNDYDQDYIESSVEELRKDEETINNTLGQCEVMEMRSRVTGCQGIIDNHCDIYSELYIELIDTDFSYLKKPDCID